MPYPTLPAPRIPYHIDGSVGMLKMNVPGNSSVVELPAATLAILNSEGLYTTIIQNDVWDTANTVTGEQHFTIMFPTPTNLAGLLLSFRGLTPTGTVTVQTSTDTTNSVDGTWSTLGEFLTSSSELLNTGSSIFYYAPVLTGSVVMTSGEVLELADTHHRLYHESGKGIHLLRGEATRGVVAIRFLGYGPNFTGANGIEALYWNVHLYGAATQEPDERLQIVRADTQKPISALDLNWGQIPGWSYADSRLQWFEDPGPQWTGSKQFRLKNMSSSKRATGIVLDFGTTRGGGMNRASAFQYSLDGTVWAEWDLAVPDIEPGGVSGVLHVRRDGTDDAHGYYYFLVQPRVFGGWVLA